MKPPLGIFIALALCSGAVGQDRPCASNPNETTIYVVRHADRDYGNVDKEHNNNCPGDDDVLTDKGRRQAKDLANTLKSRVHTLSSVYSTDCSRTEATGRPAANELAGGSVENYEEPSDLVAKIDRNDCGGSALIVGHSNTAYDVLLALGVPRQQIPSSPFNKNKILKGYGDLFVVKIPPPSVAAERYTSPR